MSNSEIQTSIPKAKLYDSYAGTVKTCSSKCNFHCKEENFYDSDASTISSFVSSPPEKESRDSGNLLPIKTNVTNIKPEAMVETDVHESSSMKEQMLSMSKHIMELAESNLHLQEKEKEVEQSKEKEINDLKNQLEKQKVENQELLDGILDMNNALHDLKNQLAYQKDKLHEKDEALKVNEENIAELKFSIATEECLKNRLANQRDEIQENLKASEQIKDKEINDLKNQIKKQKEKDVSKLQSFIDNKEIKLAEEKNPKKSPPTPPMHWITKTENRAQSSINSKPQPPEDVVSIQIDGSDKTWADISKKSLNAQKPDSNSTMPLNLHTYNPISFDMNSKNARYFVIKSFSEDDVHRSIKYGIWCSTDHGNKRLDAAFKAQKSAAIGYCPTYLFFSVNGSGYFCGMAEMLSTVDYNNTGKSVWVNNDKFKAQFMVKWIYVKDVPNRQFRHIRLENNENKPVTNSRDTQEIPLEKGNHVLKIIHNYKHETSLFDDFEYYDDKQDQETNKIVQKVDQGGDYYDQKQYSQIKDGQFGRGKDEYGGYLQQQKTPQKFFQQGDQNGQGWQKNKTMVFTRK